MLHLACETSPEWTQRALDCVDEILLDHAHCERKAASTALSLVFRYTDEPAIVQPLSELAREELAHFELMLKHLEKRGIPFRRQKPSSYAGRLMTVVRKDEPHRMLDMLLCCAMIEARSCERMSLLSEAFEEKELKSLYKSLLASEARHHQSYVGIAMKVFDEETVKVRLDEVAQHEADVIREGHPEDRLHG
ncbi:MAG: tRNA-(ms[2]io[6]A)-hydroxylase [Myxococcota bacterium]|nr:tRNA-(ms[2]io[6]A)-hydroxylase [Myxococcota bacterium]